MSKKVLAAIASLLFIVAVPVKPIFAAMPTSEVYENKRVGKITIVMENLPRGATFNQDRVLSKLQTKAEDPFSQLTFDHDLKTLSEEYDRAVPTMETSQGEVYITIKLWQKPMIRAIAWEGNSKVKTSSLQRELGIKAHTIFNREEFNRAFTKVKEYYMKKGYFDSQLEYKLIPHTNTNEIDVEITVHEGNAGHIKKICFNGFNRKEESDILNLMTTKKYNFFTSWITGTGNYHEEALEHDKLIIVNYLQNEGYADAQANIQIKESREGRLEIFINANKGEIYNYGEINISGNKLLTDKQIEKVMTIKEASTFSPEKLRDSIENIKDLYGKDGYIETDINYSLHLSQTVPVYNVDIKITEGEQFRIGLIRVLGNVSTKKNVILRESKLIPGEVFDLRKLKVTQRTLEAVGYFKSVNVYPVKTPEDQELGENYRDVIIEVEETTTGSASLFFGFSSMDDFFGGLELAENNFDHRGLKNFWKGLSNLRGAGEYAQARVQIGKKQQSYTLSWVDPYFRHSNWSFGIRLNYSKTGIQSDKYHVDSFGGSLFGSYRMTSYWTYGWEFRVKHSKTRIHNEKKTSEEAKRQLDNNGWVSGLGNSLIFDSVDNAFKPHRGFRSVLELELAGAFLQNTSKPENKNVIFPFFKMGYLNKYYYPVWRKGTLKLKWEFRFVYPCGKGHAKNLPPDERYFLGGETTVRGYRPFILGPHTENEDGTETKEPIGGISSTLLSIEYNQSIFKMLDLFTFLDGGSVSKHKFDVDTIRMGYGVGARIELGNRIPMTFGVGFPINAQKRLTKIRTIHGSEEKFYDKKKDKKIFFFSMGGQF